MHITLQYRMHRTASVAENQLSTPLAAISTKQCTTERGKSVLSLLEKTVYMRAGLVKPDRFGGITQNGRGTRWSGGRHPVCDRRPTHVDHYAIPECEPRAKAERGEQQHGKRDLQVFFVTCHGSPASSSLNTSSYLKSRITPRATTSPHQLRNK